MTTDNVYKAARQYELMTEFGTAGLFSSALATQQGALLVGLACWWSPAEVPVIVTGTNGELLRRSGEGNPLKGSIGVAREGALADLLPVGGDPVADIGLITGPLGRQEHAGGSAATGNTALTQRLVEQAR